MASWKEPPSNNLLEFARTANAGVPKRRSAPPSARPAPPVASVSVAPNVAPAIPQDSGAVMLALAPPAPSYAVAHPQVAAPRAPLAETSRAGAFLVAMAGVFGLVVSLYRNDVLYGVSHSSSWEHSYLAVEHALGSPAFGTPRSLDGMVHATPAAKSVEAPGAVANPTVDQVDPQPAPSPTSATATAAGEAAREAEPAPKGRARAVAAAAPKRFHAAAKHAAADSDEAPPKAAPPERHEESSKKAPEAKKAPEPKEAAPSLNLDDAIKASMEKKSH